MLVHVAADEDQQRPFAPLAAGKARTDLAYLDLWERPITYIEDDEIREIALGGPEALTGELYPVAVAIIPGGVAVMYTRNK